MHNAANFVTCLLNGVAYPALLLQHCIQNTQLLSAQWHMWKPPPLMWLGPADGQPCIYNSTIMNLKWICDQIEHVTWSQKNSLSSLLGLPPHRWFLSPLRIQCTRVETHLAELTGAQKSRVEKWTGQTSRDSVGSYGHCLVPLTRSSQ